MIRNHPFTAGFLFTCVLLESAVLLIGVSR